MSNDTTDAINDSINELVEELQERLKTLAHNDEASSNSVAKAIAMIRSLQAERNPPSHGC